MGRDKKPKKRVRRMIHCDEILGGWFLETWRVDVARLAKLVQQRMRSTETSPIAYVPGTLYYMHLLCFRS